MLRKVTVICLFVGSFSYSVFSESAPQQVVDLSKSTLAAYGSDAEIVKAVKAQNARKQSLADIKTLDEKWKNTRGIDDFMKSLINSECGKRLASIAKSHKWLQEIFVMDNLGANVAMNDKTSDYWQGDEAKFQKSFNNGKGAIFVDDVEFDESTQSYLVQVSVPVKDGDMVIGAITFGVNIDKL